MTDQEVIAKYKVDSDKRWVGILYKRYAHLVLGLCYKYLGDKQQAQDATCDIFMSLYDKLQEHEVDNFRAWIYTTSRNHCLMILRAAKGRKQVSLNGFEAASDDTGLQALKLKELKLDLLESALSQLPDEQARCIRRFYLEQKSYAQVAEMESIELKAVKSHIQNGKRKLRIILEQHSEYHGE